MAEMGQLAAWVGREKGFEINEAFRPQEDRLTTRGAIEPS